MQFLVIIYIMGKSRKIVGFTLKSNDEVNSLALQSKLCNITLTRTLENEILCDF
jgi:hypothetical protein